MASQHKPFYVILEIYRLQLGLLFIYYDMIHSDTLYK